MVDAAATAGYFAERFDAPVTISSLHQTFPGQSRETWMVSAEVGEGAQRRHRDLVLRIDLPSGGIVPLPLEREWEVYRRLWPSPVPVAEPLWYDEGLPFAEGRAHMVREFVEGATTVPGLTEPGPEGDELRRSVAFEHAEKLALVHSLDWQEYGLDEVLPVPASPAEAVRHEFETWKAIWFEHRSAPYPEITDALYWLEEQIPTDSPRVSLIKGNNGIGEEIWRDGRIVAMSDWELAALGDPRPGLGLLAGHARPLGSGRDPRPLRGSGRLQALAPHHGLQPALHRFQGGRLPEQRPARVHGRPRPPSGRCRHGHLQPAELGRPARFARGHGHRGGRRHHRPPAIKRQPLHPGGAVMRPSAKELLDSIAEALDTRVAPTVTDPWAASSLRSIRTLLSHLSVRVDQELPILAEGNADLREVLGAARDRLEGCETPSHPSMREDLEAVLAEPSVQDGALPTVAALEEESAALNGQFERLVCVVHDDRASLGEELHGELLTAVRAFTARQLEREAPLYDALAGPMF